MPPPPTTPTLMDTLRTKEEKKIRDQMVAKGINMASPEAANEMADEMDGFENRTWDWLYQKSLESLHKKGVKDVTFIENADDAKALGGAYQTLQDGDVDSFARLQADQFTRGMTPIKWDVYNKTKRGIVQASVEGVLGSALIGLDSMGGIVAGAGAGLYDSYGPDGMAWSDDTSTARMSKHIEVMKEAQDVGRAFTRSVSERAFGGRAAANYLAGGPNAPVLRSELAGTEGGAFGKWIVGESENVGSALGSLPFSAPSMLAPNTPVAVAAMIPFALSGYGDAQLARWDIYLEQVNQAERLGIEPPPAPSFSEMEISGAVGALFEAGSEFVGDYAQRGALKMAGGKKMTGRYSSTTVGKALREVQQSMMRGRGLVGGAKRFGAATAVGALTEGAEEVVPHIGEQVQDGLYDMFFQPDDSAWEVDRPFFDADAGASNLYLDENVRHSFKVGAYAGGMVSGGHYTTKVIKGVIKNRAVADEVAKGTSFATESIVRGQEEDAMLRFRRNVVATRSSAMAMHQAEEMAAGNRRAMFIAPEDVPTTLTPEVKARMKALGIPTKPIGKIDGKNAYAASGDIAEFKDLMNTGKVNEVVGNPMTNDSDVLAGAVVFKDAGGRIVDVMPYSNPADMHENATGLTERAQRRGLTVDVVSQDGETRYAEVEDQLRRQMDADAVAVGRPSMDTRPVPAAQTNRGLKALRLDITSSANGSKAKRYAKNADTFQSVYLTKEEVGGATNGDVKVTVAVQKVADNGLSDGERRMATRQGTNATIVDGKVIFSIKGKDGAVRTIEKPLRMDGAYISQASPDGVFLVREDGTAMTARSAYALALHEMRHRTLSRSRAGAEYFAKLLQIDPVFAMRGGADYMRRFKGGKIVEMSDAKIVAYYRGIHEAAMAVAAGVATAEQTKAVAEAGGVGRALADVRIFAEESVATTANRAAGTTTQMATEWDAIHEHEQSKSFRRFARWWAHVMVKNGLSGPEAQQAVFENRQRLDGVREEEIKIHRKFSDDVAEAFRRDMEQQAKQNASRAALQQSGQTGAAPAPAPTAAPQSVAPSLRDPADPLGPSVGGDDGGEDINNAISALQQAQQAPAEQRGSLLVDAVGLLAKVMPLLGDTSAQLGPSSRASRPQKQNPSTRPLPDEIRQGATPVQPAVEATPAQANTPDLSGSFQREQEVRSAYEIIKGDAPSSPVRPNTVARIERARAFTQDADEEIRMSLRERVGRREANDDVRNARNEFMRSRGIDPEQKIEETYAEVDESFAKRVADWYDSTPVKYDDAKMLAAYKQMGAETLDQYNHLVEQGYEIIPWGGTGQPYADSSDMLDDIRENKRLFYFKSINPAEATSFGGDPAKFDEAVKNNPLLADTGITVNDSEGQPHRQTYNDLFRGVHDILGHGAEGFQFGPRGEENAYRSHAVMFSPLARQAMATETRGQNSWVNFGPSRRNEDGSVFGKEDARYQPWFDRLKNGEGYADQKPILMPTELTALYPSPSAESRMSLRPIAQEDMTPEMKVWSKGSKIVDENGALIPVYHGTSKDTDFKKFQIGKRGAWFTTNPQEASQYAMQNDSMGWKPEPTETDPWAIRQTNTASRFIPAVLNLKNPANYYRDVSTEDKKALETSENYGREQGRVFDKLRRQGFDGVDMGNGVYVAFEPNQIKGYYNAKPSASDNRIMYSQRESDPAKIAAANAKRAKTRQLRKEADLKREAVVRKQAKLDKPAISLSTEVTAQPYLSPSILLQSAATDPSFSMDQAYARVNARADALMRSSAHRNTINQLVASITDGRVTSIGSPRTILGSFGGRVEQSWRISIPNASHEDHVLVANVLGSLFLQEATITLSAPTAKMPKSEDGIAFLFRAAPNTSAEALKGVLGSADTVFNGSSTMEDGNGVWVVYTPSSSLTKEQFGAAAKKFAETHTLSAEGAPIRSTYTETGATDVLGRKRKTTSRTGNKNSGNRGIDPRWSSWVEAAAPFAEALRDEGFDIDIAGWVGTVAGADAKAVERALIDTLAKRAAGNRHGLDWRFITRAGVSGQGLTDGRQIPATTTAANADASFAEVDALLARHPNALKDRASFERFLIDLYKSREIPIVPTDLLEAVRDNFARMRKEMNLRENGGRLTSRMIDEAIHGLEMAQRFRALYQSGKVTPTHTVALSMWGFLSRGVSPYIQESLFLDIVNYRSADGRDLQYFVDKSIAGQWTHTKRDDKGRPIQPDDSIETEWRGWVQAMFADAKYEVDHEDAVDANGDVVTRNGSVGSAASHNANAFGVSFLGNIGDQVTVRGKTQSGLLHFHEALADPTTTAKTVRRVFASLGGGLGIDNKVVGFAALVAGKTDGTVYDRVRVRDHYDRSGVYPNIYDGFTVGYVVRDGKERVFEVRSDSDFKGLTSAERDAALSGPLAQANVALVARKATPRPLDKKGRPIMPKITPIKAAGIANMFNGARGIALYEAVEASIDPSAVFADLIKIRPDLLPFAHSGAEHWLNWTGASAQEASHKTLDGLISMVSTGSDRVVEVFAKEGRYDTFHYGGEYGYIEGEGKPTAAYRYEFNGSVWQFEPAHYHAFVKGMSSFDWAGLSHTKVRGVKKSKFLVTIDSTTGATRTGPWHEDPMIGPRGRAVIEDLASQHGVRMSLRADQTTLDKFSLEFHNTIKTTFVDEDTPLAREFAAQNIAAQDHEGAKALYDLMVARAYPKPTIPNYTKYFDRDNALNGIVPNDVWWHGGNQRWTLPDPDRSKNQFGVHVGNFDQASEFFRRHRVVADRYYYRGITDSSTRPVLFPLYVRADRVIEIRDMGRWAAEDIIVGMHEMEYLTSGDRDQLLTDMYSFLGHSGNDLEDMVAQAKAGEVPWKVDTPELSLARTRFLREFLADDGIDAIAYQNVVEGSMPSPYRFDRNRTDDAVAGARVEKNAWFTGEDEYKRWVNANMGASARERLAAQKEIRGERTSVIIWGWGQIKSASASDAQYRRTAVDIRASLRSEPAAVVHMYPEVFSDQVPVRMSVRTGVVGVKDAAVVQAIDKYDALRRYHTEVERNTGMAIPDIANPYLGARVLTGRLGAMQQQATREYSMILRDMHEHRIELEDMDAFLTAQHALNGGNSYIATINPRFPDGGTGMTNGAAQAVIARAHASGRYGDMNRIAEDWRQMLRAGLILRRDAGLISTDLYNILTTRYSHYVPLRGAPARPFDELFEDYDAGEVFGRGMSTQGRGMPQRLGRHSGAEGVTSQVGFLHEDTFRRVARNEIGQRFLRLALIVNDRGMAEIVRPTAPALVNGRVREIHDANWMQDPQHFGVYVNAPMTINGHDYEAGDLVVMRINNPRLVDALITPDAQLTQFDLALRQANNVWRFLTTGMGNPTFAPVNAVRDISTGALVNVAQYGVRDTAAMLRRYPRAFSHVFRDAWFRKGNPSGSYARFVEAGGDQVYWRPNDLQSKNTDFQQLADRVARRDPQDRSLARTLLGWYPAFFTAAETASRLAAFEQRMATGSTHEQAALAARDLTVDFAKGGKRKAGLNTWYMFLNASIQGSVNVTRAAGQAAALAPSLAVFGMATAMLGRAMGGDDDELGGSKWDNIPDWVKAANIIIMDPTGSGKYITIPLPYGFSMFFSAGVRMADAALGSDTAGDVVGGIVSDGMNSFNPFGGSGIKNGAGSVVAAFMPTMFRPILEVGMNQNWMGRPIYPEPYGKQKTADSYSYFQSTPEAYTDAAKALNGLGGGDMFESGGPFGSMDISPNTMQYLVGYYTSGAGRNMDRVMKMATSNEPIEVSDIPFVRSFSGDASNDTRALSERYNAIAARTSPDVNRLEALQDPDTGRDIKTAIRERGIDKGNIRVGKVVEEADTQMRDIRKQLKTATPEQRTRLLAARDRAMARVIRADNRLHAE